MVRRPEILPKCDTCHLSLKVWVVMYHDTFATWVDSVCRSKHVAQRRMQSADFPPHIARWIVTTTIRTHNRR